VFEVPSTRFLTSSTRTFGPSPPPYFGDASQSFSAEASENPSVTGWKVPFFKFSAFAELRLTQLGRTSRSSLLLFFHKGTLDFSWGFSFLPPPPRRALVRIRTVFPFPNGVDVFWFSSAVPFERTLVFLFGAQGPMFLRTLGF